MNLNFALFCITAMVIVALFLNKDDVAKKAIGVLAPLTKSFMNKNDNSLPIDNELEEGQEIPP